MSGDAWWCLVHIWGMSGDVWGMSVTHFHQLSPIVAHCHPLLPNFCQISEFIVKGGNGISA